MIRQVVVARFEDFPGALQDRALADGKRPEAEAHLLSRVDERLRELLGDHAGRVHALPALRWRVRLPEKFTQLLPPPEWLVIAMVFPDLASVHRFRAEVE